MYEADQSSTLPSFWSTMKKRASTAQRHLADDMKGYKSQRKHLSKEIKEDKELSKSLKKSESPKNMSRYKGYSKKEMEEHIAKEKKILKRKK